MVILGLTIARLLEHRPRARPVVAVLLGATLAWQVGVSHRSFLPTTAGELAGQAQDYAEELRSLVPADCPILQLPVVAFPEGWEDSGRMGVYDHMWMPVYAPEYRWSFGIVKSTAEWNDFQSRYSADLPLTTVFQNARTDGFCAVHVDELGAGRETRLDVEAVLRAEVAHEGRWFLYRLEAP
jgi:hypothetical protein